MILGLTFVEISMILADQFQDPDPADQNKTYPNGSGSVWIRFTKTTRGYLDVNVYLVMLYFLMVIQRFTFKLLLVNVAQFFRQKINNIVRWRSFKYFYFFCLISKSHSLLHSTSKVNRWRVARGEIFFGEKNKVKEFFNKRLIRYFIQYRNTFLKI